MKTKIKKYINEYEDYVGSHKAPLKNDDTSSPLYNVTQKTYPEDFYSFNGLRYYNGGFQYDSLAYYIIVNAKNKPNKSIKIYRAIPNFIFDLEQERKTLLQASDDIYEYNFLGWTKRNYSEELRDEISKLDKKEEKIELIQNKLEEVHKKIKQIKKKMTINHGDWVSLTREYAKEHGQTQFGKKYKILSKNVKAKNLYTDGNSLQEWGYDNSI